MGTCVAGRLALQRLFSTFPGGRPGIGLLLLRAVVGGIAIALGILCAVQIERATLVWVAAVTLMASGVALVLGFVTPIASLLVVFCVLGMTLEWFPSAPPALLGGRLMVLLLVTTAFGICLLGPGAFSLDGYLFGRREIVFPPRTPES